MKKPDSLNQVHALKTTIVALLALGLGIALLVVARGVEDHPAWAWLSFWPLGELGSILVGAGLLGIVWDYFDGKDKEARDTERLRRVLAEAAPDLRDAVVEGFAINSDGLKRVATPELLDSIASNAMRSGFVSVMAPSPARSTPSSSRTLSGRRSGGMTSMSGFGSHL